MCGLGRLPAFAGDWTATANVALVPPVKGQKPRAGGMGGFSGTPAASRTSFARAEQWPSGYGRRADWDGSLLAWATIPRRLGRGLAADRNGVKSLLSASGCTPRGACILAVVFGASSDVSMPNTTRRASAGMVSC